MEVHGGKIEGPCMVDRNLVIHGMVVDRAAVRPGRTLELHGTVKGDLVVESGARAKVLGTVSGTEINDSGYVEVHGTVGGVAKTTPTSRTVIGREAVVGGQA